MSTIQALITRVEQELSQAAGSGVQLYSSDRIANNLVTAFNLVFNEDWWPDYCDWFTCTLDGVTGIITADIGIRRFRDIRGAWITNTEHRLPQLPMGINPNNLIGSLPMYIEGRGNPTGQVRPFRIWPKAATGTIEVHGRMYPSSFALTTDIKFDDDLMAFGAAWQYSADDGHNPAQITKFQNLFDTSLKQIQRDHVSNNPIKLDPRLANIPTQWQEIG